MARRSSASSRDVSSGSGNAASGRRDPYERQSFNLDEATEESKPKGVWCLLARVTAEADGEENRAGELQPGSTVYCFPPMRGGAFESVEVIGPHRKTGKLAEAVIAARDLTDWRASTVTEAEVLEKISPPWDSSHVSQNVAMGIVAWKAGGHWPANDLRVWNRSRAERVVGEGSIFARLRGKIMSLFGKE
jgi:hypothetical protein